jgi:hypothetical protein
LEITGAGPTVIDRNRLGESFPELDVTQTHGARGFSRLRQHLRRHVHTHDASTVADLSRGDEGVEPRTGTDIYDPFAGLQTAQRQGIADASERLDCGIGQLVSYCLLVAQTMSQLPTGVEVVGLLRFDCDSPVLLTHLRSKVFGVDGDLVAHAGDTASTACVATCRRMKFARDRVTGMVAVGVLSTKAEQLLVVSTHQRDAAGTLQVHVAS